MNDAGIIYKIIRRREGRKKEIEAKPFEASAMADIAFLLLIFFIVTSSFIIRQGLFFSLPSRSAGKARVDESRVFEVFPKNEGFLYQGSMINRGKLLSLLKVHAAKGQGSIMIIKMSPDIKYDRLVDTLSAAKESGIAAVSLKNIE